MILHFYPKIRYSEERSELSDINQEKNNVPDDIICVKNICENEHGGRAITAIKNETKGKICRIQGCNQNGLQGKKRGGVLTNSAKKAYIIKLICHVSMKLT